MSQHRPVPRRTSSSFLSAFSNQGSVSSASSPVLPNQSAPPTSFHQSFGIGKEFRSTSGPQQTGIDEGSESASVYSDTTHSTAVGGGSSLGYAAATDTRSYAGSVASAIGGGGGTGQWGSRVALVDMLNKRVGTWDALKRAHQGTLYWSNTIHLPIPAIQANVEPSTFRSRPYAFSLLGMSLAPLLDIQNLSEIILCGTRTLDQFDTAAAHLAGGTSANKGGTMKGIFKGGSKSGKRPSLGAGGAGGDGPADNYGADYLVVCPQPFPPDYFQTMTTFFDMLLDLYTKLHSLVAAHAASAASAQSQLHALPTPLAVALEKVYPTLISPSSSTPTSQSPATPLTSVNSASWRQATPQQVQGAFSPAQSTDDVSGIQSPPLTLNGSTLIGGTVRSGSIGGSGETLRQDVVDGIHKLDSRIRKLTNVVMKELEALARKEIKDEVSQLESLLSVISPSDTDHFTPPSGLATASLWALGTAEADRVTRHLVHA